MTYNCIDLSLMPWLHCGCVGARSANVLSTINQNTHTMKNQTFFRLMAGALLATSLLTTSCIDSDEPDGISLLRESKAKYIDAETLLKQAEATKAAAEVELVQLNIQLQTVEVEIRKIELERQKLALELEAAQNEAEKARIQRQMELAASQHEYDVEALKLQMLSLKTLIAQAQQEYEIAIKNIEIANATLDPASGDYPLVTAAYNKFIAAKKAYMGYLNGSTFVNGTQQKLAAAQEDLLDAIADYTGDAKIDSLNTVHSLSRTLKEKKADYEDAQEDYEIAKQTLEAAPALLAEADALSAKYDEYTEQIDEIDVELRATKEPYELLAQAVKDADAAYKAAKDAIGDERTAYGDEEKYYSFTITNEDLVEYFKYNYVSNFSFDGVSVLYSEAVISNRNIHNYYSDFSDLKSLAESGKDDAGKGDKEKEAWKKLYDEIDAIEKAVDDKYAEFEVSEAQATLALDPLWAAYQAAEAEYSVYYDEVIEPLEYKRNQLVSLRNVVNDALEAAVDYVADGEAYAQMREAELEALADAVETAAEAVEDAALEVEKAQIRYDEFLAGEVSYESYITYYREEVERAIKNNDAAKAAYEEALAEFEKVYAILTGSAAE